LLILDVARLHVLFDSDRRPSLAGFQFFFWHQVLWATLTSLLIYVVHPGLK
jgi:hypothetical protein